jgi:hypothetical protein
MCGALDELWETEVPTPGWPVPGCLRQPPGPGCVRASHLRVVTHRHRACGAGARRVRSTLAQRRERTAYARRAGHSSVSGGRTGASARGPHAGTRLGREAGSPATTRGGVSSVCPAQAARPCGGHTEGIVIRPVGKLSELSTYTQIWKPGPGVDRGRLDRHHYCSGALRRRLLLCPRHQPLWGANDQEGRTTGGGESATPACQSSRRTLAQRMVASRTRPSAGHPTRPVSPSGSVKGWRGRASSMSPGTAGSCGPTKRCKNASGSTISVRLATIFTNAGLRDSPKAVRPLSSSRPDLACSPSWLLPSCKGPHAIKHSLSQISLLYQPHCGF